MSKDTEEGPRAGEAPRDKTKGSDASAAEPKRSAPKPVATKGRQATGLATAGGGTKSAGARATAHAGRRALLQAPSDRRKHASGEGGPGKGRDCGNGRAGGNGGAGAGGLGLALVRRYDETFATEPRNRLALNAVAAGKVQIVARNREAVVRGEQRTFSHVVKTADITNQKQSGRCWMFAGQNVAARRGHEALEGDQFEFCRPICSSSTSSKRPTTFLRR